MLAWAALFACPPVLSSSVSPPHFLNSYSAFWLHPSNKFFLYFKSRVSYSPYLCLTYPRVCPISTDFLNFSSEWEERAGERMRMSFSSGGEPRADRLLSQPWSPPLEEPPRSSLPILLEIISIKLTRQFPDVPAGMPFPYIYSLFNYSVVRHFVSFFSREWGPKGGSLSDNFCFFIKLKEYVCAFQKPKLSCWKFSAVLSYW